MKFAKYLLLLSILTAPGRGLSAFETDDFAIYLEIRQMKHARPPYFLGNNLILSFETDHPVRFVGAAFSHENFSNIHSFVKNEYNTFVLIYPLPANKGIEELKYRIVVDGLWMADPLSKKTISDANGIKLSYVMVPERLTRITTSPLPMPDGNVRFLYLGPSNRNIYLVGDFNNWDPFMHKMHENEEGRYEISLPLLPGDHYYYFLSNGTRILDPMNPERGVDFEGVEVSHFVFSPYETAGKPYR